MIEKENIQNSISVLFLLPFLSAWVTLQTFSGCVAHTTTSESNLKLEAVSDLTHNLAQTEKVQKKKFSQRWKLKMRGAIADLSFSKNGQAILVATRPDPDIEGSADHLLLTSLNARGRQVWSHKLSSPVKEQDLSDDGKLAVISNYENQILGYNPAGKILWTAEGVCKPKVLNPVRKILCYHDDDADPQVAFDVFDWKGKKLLSYPIEGDVMVLKLSQDQHWIALGLTGGRASLVSTKNFQPLWEKKLPDEIVDLAVTSGGSRVTAVLSTRPKAKNESSLTIWDAQGNILGESILPFHAIQVEMSPQGDQVFVYGNSAFGVGVGGVGASTRGQVLESLAVPSMKGLWKFQEPYASEYAFPMLVVPHVVLVGWEGMEGLKSMKGMKSLDTASGRNHILGFEYSVSSSSSSSSGAGGRYWDLPVLSTDEVYLYQYRYSPESERLVVATDDGNVMMY